MKTYYGAILTPGMMEPTPLQPLKPCPFCGNAPTLLVRATGYNELRFVISCPGPCEMKDVSTGQYQRQDECVAAWNHRATTGARKGEGR